MKPSPVKVRPAAKIFGGKSYLARKIIELLPATERYVEPYGGLASVGLNLPRPTRQHPRLHVYNDINTDLYNLFQVARLWPEQLQVALATTLYSEAAFDVRANYHPVEVAARTYARMQFSFAGKGESFSRSKDRTRRGIADVVAAHLSKIDDNLPLLLEIVRDWQIESRPALECIRYYDSPATLFYIDPTYHPDCKAKGSTYENEMTAEDHEELLKQLLVCQGRVAISHYRHPLYDSMLRQWRCCEIDIANHAAGGREKRRMVECVWMNYAAEDVT